MRTRSKKEIAILLSAAMMLSFSINTAGMELCPDEPEYENQFETVDEATDEKYEKLPSSTVLSVNDTKVMPEQIKMVSENWDTLEAYLSGSSYVVMEGDNCSFVIKYKPVVLYGGNVKDSLGIPEVYYRSGESLSGNDIEELIKEQEEVSEIRNKIREDGIYSAEVTKVKMRSSKGATVDVTGRGFVPANKCSYIKSIKLEDKDLNRELKIAMKRSGYTDRIKKEKKACISGNGCKVGGTYGKEEDMFPLSIAVYPDYIGGDLDGIGNFPKICEALFNSVSAETIVEYEEGDDGEEDEEKIKRVYRKNKYGTSVSGNDGKYSYHLPDWAYKLNDNNDRHWKIKEKDGKIKSLKSYLGRNQTLKPDKNGKKKGLVDGGEEFSCTVNHYGEEKDAGSNPVITKTVNYKGYRVEADGNYFGIIYCPLVNTNGAYMIGDTIIYYQ